MTREEAIRRIKAWNLDSDDMEVLSALIPELTESEDEMIRKEIIEFLRLPHPQFVGKRNHEEWIAYLERQKEQKPAGWSEQDEMNLYNIIEAIKYVYDVSEGSGGSRLIAWLKFHLRPQSHWKPSEEQMRAVFDASERNDGLGSVLRDFYNDLKRNFSL